MLLILAEEFAHLSTNCSYADVHQVSISPS